MVELTQMAKSNFPNAWLQVVAFRVTRLHFLFALAFVFQTIVFDSWNLLAHQAVARRWTAVAFLVVLNTVLWLLARLKINNAAFYRGIVMTLVVADIVFAGFNVYWERGMASTSVILFSVALATAATLCSRSMLFAAATLSSVAYSTAAVLYFNLFYGEGFRVQLYGQIGFYSALFFIMVMLLMVFVRLPKNSS